MQFSQYISKKKKYPAHYKDSIYFKEKGNKK